ncbi:MAG: DUF1223 domain-containing protein [Bdellovibrionales bacterium]|nr:DUF1223 domain-containing protein [Bdellovibrionales bacterium]
MEKIILLMVLLVFSEAQAATVIELFTSQGCSSCPPAEKWIGQLRKHPDFMKGIIPMVWHVDYWDQLGWKDTLAKPEFTERQRKYAATWKSQQVYTPGVIVDGQEKRNWRDLSLAPNHTSQEFDIKREDKRLNVVYRPAPGQKLWLAIVSDGPSIPIQKGENAGRKLSRDFVVTSLQEGKEKQGSFSWDISGAEGHAVIWLEDSGDPKPKQATAIRL